MSDNCQLTNMLKGIYTLLIKLDKPLTIIIGRLGRVSFSAGHYAYVGSALNGLESRVARHLRKEKVLHWHIDYFLQKAMIGEIIYSMTEKDRECTIAFQLGQKLTPVPHFGCSDCRCESHLYFCKDKWVFKDTISTSFKKSGLAAYRMTVDSFKRYGYRNIFSLRSQ